MDASAAASVPRYARPMRIAALLLLLAACGDDAPTRDAGADAPLDAPLDAAADTSGDAGLDDAGAADAPPDAGARETVEVGHPREVRGTWIATVSRINWPKTDDPAQQRDDLEAIFDDAVAAGLNTIYFQVRPEADALYASDLEPWSRFLTGTQGVDPGYDPLAFAIEKAHARGLELHAWLNPYRARAGSGATSADHVSQTMPDAVVTYGSQLWLDPGHPDAFEHTLAVVRDIVRRYDVDGVHMDDYFYPYPMDGVTFDDDATYAAYGGGLSRADWRRDNVNRMVRRVGEVVAEEDPTARWGISPFGIYRPGMPEGVVGLDQYSTLYADVLAWMRGGWLDYVAPQLYWPTTSSGQPFGDLLDWWADRAAETGRTLLIGSSVSRRYGLAEYERQLDLVQAARDRNARGMVWWSVAPILTNEDGLRDMLARRYAAPAASPPLVTATVPPPAPDAWVASDAAIEVRATGGALRYWAAYRDTGAGWQLEVLAPASEARLLLPAGRWAISAIARDGLESRGVVVETSGVEPPPPPPPPPGRSCTHSFGGEYVDRGCSPSYQCCDGTWRSRGACGPCACEEASGSVGCSG